jgi:uncharacterized membrane protein YkoI
MKRAGLFIVWIVALVVLVVLQNSHFQPKTHQNVKELSRMMHITLSPPTTKPKLTPQEAISIANKNSSYDATHAKQIIVEYQLITDKASQVPHYGFMKRVPGYIVSYEGLHVQGHGYSRNHIPAENTEINFVIDANTGQLLVAFSYR